MCWHNLTQSAYLFHDFFVSIISERPTDLSSLKEFSKNVCFGKFYIFPFSPNRGHWVAIYVLWLYWTTSTISEKLSLLNFQVLIFWKSLYQTTSTLPNFFRNLQFNQFNLASTDFHLQGFVWNTAGNTWVCQCIIGKIWIVWSS